MRQADLFAVPVESPVAAGIRRGERALAHANRVHRDWSVAAERLARAFAAMAPGPFLAEDVRMYAEEMGLSRPPDRRSWGGVITRLARARVITQVGFSPDGYGSPKARWARTDLA